MRLRPDIIAWTTATLRVDGLLLSSSEDAQDRPEKRKCPRHGESRLVSPWECCCMLGKKPHEDFSDVLRIIVLFNIMFFLTIDEYVSSGMLPL